MLVSGISEITLNSGEVGKTDQCYDRDTGKGRCHPRQWCPGEEESTPVSKNGQDLEMGKSTKQEGDSYGGANCGESAQGL